MDAISIDIGTCTVRYNGRTFTGKVTFQKTAEKEGSVDGGVRKKRTRVDWEKLRKLWMEANQADVKVDGGAAQDLQKDASGVSGATRESNLSNHSPDSRTPRADIGRASRSR